VADRASWVTGVAPDAPFEAEVQIRYRGRGVPAVITREASDSIRVAFRTPQHAVAPGQSVVIYRADELLGGARIVEAVR
jgi:tRNA-uridine 2-sulfurtransferase